MSFLTTQPEELAAAAGKLETIGSAMVAQNAAAAAPTTTGVIPAAADEISVLQAPLFTAYGTLYQQVSAEAAAVYDLFVKTLGVSAGTYAATEAANSSAAASPLSGIASILGSTPGKVPSWISDIANIFNIGAGNWASAASDLLGLASGGLLPAAEEAALEEGLEGAGLSELGAAEAAVGEAPIAAGLGAAPLAAGLSRASSIGALSVPAGRDRPTWYRAPAHCRALAGPPRHRMVPRGRSFPGCRGWPRRRAAARASVRHATAPNPSSCPSRRYRGRPRRGCPHLRSSEFRSIEINRGIGKMDFGALPPEINSTRMYAGAGAAPLMAAGATWNGLAVELSTTASSVESVIMQLTTEQWLGPASMSMVVAAQPYLAWLTYTAESAAHAAAQAMASAAAFEAAFAMTVPPAEVAANRALLAALVATNVLGQNTPAIMATEAHYGEMWAQDALAMYGYAASSAAAGRLNPLITPSQTANMAGLAGQAAAVSHAAAASTVQQVGLGSLISNLPNAVMGFASPLTSAADAAGLGGIIQDIEELLGITFVQNAINGAVNTTAWFVMATIPNAVFLGHAFAALNPATVTAAADAVPAAAAAAGLAHTVTPVGVGGASLTASLGEASSVGGLSVPAGWSTAAPAMTSGTTALEGSGWAVPEEAGPVAAMPGMAGISGAAKGAGAYAGPRYGFKPIVMPKQVVV